MMVLSVTSLLDVHVRTAIKKNNVQAEKCAFTHIHSRDGEHNTGMAAEVLG
jgi:hypothetical protein